MIQQVATNNMTGMRTIISVFNPHAVQIHSKGCNTVYLPLCVSTAILTLQAN